MARFFRTSGANPLDYVYKMNVPLMERVLTANDKYIDQSLTQLGGLNTAVADIPYLQADESRTNEIVQGYTDKINDVANTIKQDPANWRKQLNSITQLGQDLQRNFKTGEISKISENYNRYKKTTDYIDKQVEEYNKTGKGISADRAKAYKQYYLTQFIKANPKGTSYNPQTGEYNLINTFDPMANVDVRKTLSDELDKLKSDGTIKITDGVTGSGEYFNKETNKWEGVTPDRILNIITGRLNNPQLMDYLKQDTQVGLVNGVYDTNPDSTSYGRFISPYSYDKTPLSTSEQSVINTARSQIAKTKDNNTRTLLESQLNDYVNKLNGRTQLSWNKDSYLAPILRSIVDEYSFNKTDQENDLSANNIWSTKFTQSQNNIRNQANITARDKAQQKLFTHQENMQDDKLRDQIFMKMIDWGMREKVAQIKADAAAKKAAGLKPIIPGATPMPATPTTTTKADTTKTNPIVALPIQKTNTDNSIIGNLTTTPFYWTTEDKDKMTISLNNEIDVSKNKIGQLNSTLSDLQANHPDNKIMIANVQNQLGTLNSKMNTLEGQRENAISYAVGRWRDKGDNRERSAWDKFTGDSPIPYSDDNEKVLRSYLSGRSKTDYDKLSGDFTKLEARRSSIDKDSPEYANFMRSEYYPAQTKLATAKNVLITGQRIFNNEVKSDANDKLEKGAKETTNRADIVQTTKPQDDRILTMITTSPSNYKIRDNTGKEIALSFEHGTASPKDFVIKGAAITTGLGDKGVELAATVNGKDVIITPKDDGNVLNNYLSGEFQKSKDGNVKEIGRILGSPVAGTMSDLVTEMRMNTNSSYGTKDAWVYKTIPNPANPNETIRIRGRSVSTGAGEPKWELQFETSDPKLIINNAGKGESYVSGDGNMKGFVPLTSTKSTNGEYHNLGDILSIFPANM